MRKKTWLEAHIFIIRLVQLIYYMLLTIAGLNIYLEVVGTIHNFTRDEDGSVPQPPYSSLGVRHSNLNYGKHSKSYGILQIDF